jgi:hypothetical protein
MKERMISPILAGPGLLLVNVQPDLRHLQRALLEHLKLWRSQRRLIYLTLEMMSLRLLHLQHRLRPSRKTCLVVMVRPSRRNTKLIVQTTLTISNRHQLLLLPQHPSQRQLQPTTTYSTFLTKAHLSPPVRLLPTPVPPLGYQCRP